MSDTTPAGIDPRAPRFAAAITSVLLLVATFFALVGISTRYAPGFIAVGSDPSTALVLSGWAVASASPWQRMADPGFLAVLVVALLFLWGVLSPRTAPWGVVFRRLVRPRLRPPAELEDPRPPRFAQGVGLFVTGLGLALHVLGVPWALPIAAAAAFVAAFLNAAFGVCLGCMMYLGLQRLGIVGRAG